MGVKPTLLFEEYTMIHIEYTHHPPIAGGGAAPTPITRKRDDVFCPDSSDKERLLHVINEYIDACDDHLLHIHDNDRYVNFAQVIGGSLKMTWTEIITTHQPLIANRTDANFQTDIHHFTRHFLPSNAAQLQKDYLNDPKINKPRDFDCFETRSRLELLNHLSQYLPGSAGNSMYPDALSQMNAYFKLMLDPWQLKWTENGNSTDQPDMTMSRLVDFMEQQHLFHKARQPQSRTRHNTPQRQSTYYNRNPPNNRYDNPYFSPNRGGARRPYRGSGGGRSPEGRVENSSSLYILISCYQGILNSSRLSCSLLPKIACLHVSFTAYENFYKLSKMHCPFILIFHFPFFRISECRNPTIKHISNYTCP